MKRADMVRPIALIVALVVALQGTAVTAGAATPKSQVSLSWREAVQLALHHKVSLVLPNTAMVEGKVLSFTEDSLDLEMTKTSDAKVQSKGKVTIPRDKLHTLVLHRVGVKNRIIFAAVGMGIGIPLGIGAAISSNETGSGNENGLVVLPAAGAALGYLGGWALDHHDLTITIL